MNFPQASAGGSLRDRRASTSRLFRSSGNGICLRTCSLDSALRVSSQMLEFGSQRTAQDGM